MTKKTALLLCGGGSRGILQLGMIEAWIDSKLEYDAVYAGSVGALNAMLYLQDQMVDLRSLWMNIQNKDVYKPRILSLYKLFTNDASVNDSFPLEQLIRKHL